MKLLLLPLIAAIAGAFVYMRRHKSDDVETDVIEEIYVAPEPITATPASATS